MKVKSLLIILPILAFGLFGFNQDSKTDKQFTADEIRDVLKSANLKFEEEADPEGKTMFTIGDEDEVQVELYQYGGDGDVATSLALHVEFEAPDGKVPTEAINDWNRDMRWTKTYATEEDAIALEEDLDLAAGVSKDVVKKYIVDFMKTLPEFEEHIASAE